MTTQKDHGLKPVKTPAKEAAGRILRGYREALGFSIRDTAEQIGVSRHCLEQWERGIRFPGGKFPELIRFLEIPLCDVIRVKRLMLGLKDHTSPGDQKVLWEKVQSHFKGPGTPV